MLSGSLPFHANPCLFCLMIANPLSLVALCLFSNLWSVLIHFVWWLLIHALHCSLLIHALHCLLLIHVCGCGCSLLLLFVLLLSLCYCFPVGLNTTDDETRIVKKGNKRTVVANKDKVIPRLLGRVTVFPSLRLSGFCLL